MHHHYRQPSGESATNSQGRPAVDNSEGSAVKFTINSSDIAISYSIPDCWYDPKECPNNFDWSTVARIILEVLDKVVAYSTAMKIIIKI